MPPVVNTPHRALHDLQWAVSHNSYESDQQYTKNDQPFPVGQFYEQGFRGIELDINRDVDHMQTPEWCVNHGVGFSDDYKLLSTYLADICSWCQGKPQHDLVVVHLDCKDVDVNEGFPGDLDAYLLRGLGGQQVYRPGDLLRPGSDLVQSAMASGWHALAELTGRVMFILTGETRPKANYARTDPTNRLCFADLDIDFAFAVDAGTRIIANDDAAIDHPGFDYGQWSAGQRGLLWRSYTAVDAPTFTTLASRGANMVAAEAASFTPPDGGGYWLNPKAGAVPGALA